MADPERYEGKTKAEEAMLTPDMLQWSIGATIGIKLAFPFLRPFGSKRHPSGCRARAAELNLLEEVLSVATLSCVLSVASCRAER